MEPDIEPGDPILQAQDAAYRAGLKPEEFGRLTHWELNQYLEARHERRQDDLRLRQELDLIHAYQTIGYLAAAMSKRGMPSLASELARLRAGGSGRLSPEASAAAVKTWLGTNLENLEN